MLSNNNKSNRSRVTYPNEKTFSIHYSVHFVFSICFLILAYHNTMSANSTVTKAFYQHMPLYVKRLSEHAILPTRGSDYAAGLDISSAVDMIIAAGQRALVNTDLMIACPAGTYGRIAPRSGLAYKHGIDVGAGVIDADYRGPLGVILFNFGSDDFIIEKGDRIAQILFEQIILPDVMECIEGSELPTVGIRGEAGFGSTGIETNTAMKKNTANDNDAQTNDSNKKLRANIISPSTSADEMTDS
jgi:dUTP pyrophosphatase